MAPIGDNDLGPDAGAAAPRRSTGARPQIGAAGSDEPRWKKRVRRIGQLAAVLTLLASPWWGRAILREMDFFRVRRVVIEGARYASPDEIVSRLRVDTTTASIWDDVSPLVARVKEHPQVRDVRIGRRLPGTLVVRVTENPPVAFVNTTKGLVVTDADGKPLPVDPTRTDVDLPVLASRDTLLLRLLGEVRAEIPSLFARVSEARRGSRGDIVLVLAEHRILAKADVSAARLAEVLPVELDLARRGRTVTELDLRFKDQVVARLP
ncbi:MAG: FtsQ-type POTRA domain-containing protein [Gemmatimonadetes bacterium]|jgi:cell division protein FtsQ|nr:FtsQ-type POTRA domain-containing protein [Gemmatimonadota bacterium]MBP7549208.1 FtsQ-type POTRA domain-containing protein [Gemmatimonadaceae bacterium]